MINGILWRLRLGTPWRDVPEKYGDRNTIYPRSSKSGVWESVATALAETMAESGPYTIDSTSVRAHLSTADGKGGFIDELLAARGHRAVATRYDQLAETFLGILISRRPDTGSNLSAQPAGSPVSLMPGATPSPSASRPGGRGLQSYKTVIDLSDRPPKALLADKAYDTDAIRSDL